MIVYWLYGYETKVSTEERANEKAKTFVIKFDEVCILEIIELCFSLVSKDSSCVLSVSRWKRKDIAENNCLKIIDLNPLIIAASSDRESNQQKPTSKMSKAPAERIWID